MKAITEEAVQRQVAGLRLIGLLAVMVLHLRGAEFTGLDFMDANTARP